MPEHERFEIRAGGNVYRMLIIVSAFCVLFPIGVYIFSAITQNGFIGQNSLEGLLVMLLVFLAFPALVLLIVLAFRITITESDFSYWQAGSYSGTYRMKLADIDRVVEDRYSSRGDLYFIAPVHSLVIFPKGGVQGREMVINMKPYRDEDIQRLFQELRERGVKVEEYARRSRTAHTNRK